MMMRHAWVKRTRTSANNSACGGSSGGYSSPFPYVMRIPTRQGASGESSAGFNKARTWELVVDVHQLSQQPVVLPFQLIICAERPRQYFATSFNQSAIDLGSTFVSLLVSSFEPSFQVCFVSTLSPSH